MDKIEPYKDCGLGNLSRVYSYTNYVLSARKINV